MRSTNSHWDIFRKDVYFIIDFKDTIGNRKTHFFTEICDLQNKR